MRAKISLVSCGLGLALCALIGLEPLLPGEGGCAHGWIFNCEAVQRSSAAVLLGVPQWIWGGAWFVLIGALTLWLTRRGERRLSVVHVAAVVAVTLGWLQVSRLRGVELFAIQAACLVCWLVALAAIFGGLDPLLRALGAVSRPGRMKIVALMALGLIAAFLSPAVIESEEDRAALRPALPGWQWVEGSGVPLEAADFLVCDSEAPTLVYVYDPFCDDCQALIEGPLSEEMWREMLADLCRVAVFYDDLLTSALILEAPRTPAMILLGPEGAVITSVAGEIGDEELITLIEAAYSP